MAASAVDRLLKRILTRDNLPTHVAIIMDGNGRWARKRGKPRTAGHREGVKAVKRTVTAAVEAQIKALTLYAFSTENWRRPRVEVAAIMHLLYETTKREMREMLENNIRLTASGDLDGLSSRQRMILLKAMEMTRDNTGLVLNLALNYSGRAEILQAVKRIASDVARKNLALKNLDEATFAGYLQTDGLPDPDLLIRTSGEYRLSNFLLWQTSYTELYITDTLWPDFTREDFFRALDEYQKRERRFGRVPQTRKRKK
ncbi:isoprenyl transferase [Candidatus Zixiibacteriota bacterium]